MPTYVVRLWLPDRPGTLGQVAAAIGSADADVIGIEILERGAGMAIDELMVSVPEGRSADDVVAALAKVDGVAVEDVHSIAADRPDHGVMALGVVAAFLEAGEERRLDVICDEALKMLEADWVAVVDVAASRVTSASGVVPDTSWLIAFLTGTAHLPASVRSEHTPSDVVWTSLGESGLAMAGERRGRAFRERERQQLDLIGRVAGAVL
jgi:hypothetical protein